MNSRDRDLAANLVPPLPHLDLERIVDLEAQPLPLFKKGIFYPPFQGCPYKKTCV